MVNAEQLDSLNAEQLRALARALIGQAASREELLAAREHELKYRQAKIDQLTHEMAVLKRWKFGKSGERLDAAQLSLFDETLDADIAAIEVELQRWHLRPEFSPITSSPDPDVPGCHPGSAGWRLPTSLNPPSAPRRVAAAPAP